MSSSDLVLGEVWFLLCLPFLMIRHVRTINVVMIAISSRAMMTSMITSIASKIIKSYYNSIKTSYSKLPAKQVMPLQKVLLVTSQLIPE